MKNVQLHGKIVNAATICRKGMLSILEEICVE